MSFITQNYKLFILLIALLSMPAAGAYAQGGQSTPEELGKSKAAATQANDKAALKALIHPEVLKHMQENNPQKLEELLQAWMQITIPENYMFGVKPVSEISEYDAKTQSMNVTGQTMHFPIPPTHFMVFVIEQEQTVKVGGKEEKRMMKIPLGVDPIRQDKGKWYILLPVIQQ
jgi:hypothetical protein